MTIDDPAFVDQYILNNFKHMFSWEACLQTKLDETTEYEKIYSSDSDGYYEMKTYEDHSEYYLNNSNKDLNEIKEIINNDSKLTAEQKQIELDKLEWEWTGDKFINTFDYRFKSTIIVKIEKPKDKPAEPINVRLHFNVYNDLGGTFYVDPLIQIKPLN
jgi:phage terminase large subunit-like protein